MTNDKPPASVRHWSWVILRRWFLLCVVAGLTASLLWPDLTRPLIAWIPVQAVVAGALFLTAWGLESRRLLRAFTRPGSVLWAVIVSYGFLPGLAWLGGMLLPSSDMRVGLLVMAAVPCTLASAVLWTRMARGNDATALLIVLTLTLIGPLAAPAWLSLVGGGALSAGQMMLDLALVLVLPVAVAQCSRAIPAVARTTARHKTAAGVVAQLLILIVMLKAAVDLTHHLSQLTPGLVLLAAVVCLAVHMLALFLGFAGGRVLGFERGDCIAVAFSGSQKTLPVALYVYQTYFAHRYPLAVLPLALFHVGQLLVDTLVADRLAGPVPERATS